MTEEEVARGTEILSVAPHFGVGSIPFAGHEEAYQLGLRRAATVAGVLWRILVPVGSTVRDPAAVPCLDLTGPDAIAESVDRYLRRPVGDRARSVSVVVYEGDTDLAAAFARVAPAHPSVRFLVNLFRAEPGLDVPLVRRKQFGTGLEADALAPEVLGRNLGELAKRNWPENVLLTAESHTKALMARSAGLPVRGVWHLHSEMIEIDVRTVPAPSPSTDRPTRVLIAARSSQLRPPLLRDVLDVIDGVSRIERGQRLAWVMSGRFDVDRRVMTALRRLERAGVEVIRSERPLEPTEYAQGFLDVDAVWMPAAWPYRVQSSGKALDALVLGRPVIAPAGTAGAREMERWAPGAPTYGTNAEAVQLFLRLPTLSATLKGALSDSREAIRLRYSAVATVEWVLSQLAGSPPIVPQEPSTGGDVAVTEADTAEPSAVGRRILGGVADRLRPVGRMVSGVPRGLRDLWFSLLDRR